MRSSCPHGGAAAIRYHPVLNQKTLYLKTIKVLPLPVLRGGESD
jgi:hypothetical protein